MFAALVVVAQLKSCATNFCPALDMSERATHTIRVSGPNVFDFAPLSDGDLLVLSGASSLPPRYERVIERWSERSGSQRLISLEWDDITGEGIVAVDDRNWWYTAGGVYRNRNSGMFITFVDGRADAPKFVSLPVPGENVWLPLRGAKPQGLYVFLDHGTPGAMRVTPDGIAVRWRFAEARMNGIGWWSAQLLPNGSIALVSLERGRLVLRLLHGAAYEEIYNQVADDAGLSTAVDADGTLAIVTRTRAEAVEVILVDPADPAHARHISLTEPDERGSYPTVARSSSGFIVIWISGSDHAWVRARSLTHTSAALWAATVGPIHVPPDTRPFMGAVYDGRDLLFLWDRGAIAIRRLPTALASFELVSELNAKLCSQR